jgi:DNA-binding winged helix-turn-helix (wHTH) protein
VSESALTSRIKAARQAVGDDGTAQAVIRTVHGRGYEFVAEVAVTDDAPRPAPADAPLEQEIGSARRTTACASRTRSPAPGRRSCAAAV